MDLGQCPRCGKPWVIGAERCESCGFVPIGAGLSNLPKKKRRKVRPYREGSASVPILLAFLVAMVGYYAATRRPWENNFEEFRVVVLGQAAPLRIQGDWEVTKLVALDPKTKTPLAPLNLVEGRMTFDGKGGMNADLRTDTTPWTAKSSYVQDGATVVLSRFATDPPSQMPTAIKCQLVDLGEGNAMVKLGDTSALFLHRIQGREKISKVLRYRLLNGLLKGKGSE